MPKGGQHGNIKGAKKNRVYEGLRKAGKTKAVAAKIANAGRKAWAKGGRKSHK